MRTLAQRWLLGSLCVILLLGAGSAQAISKRELEQRIIRLERLIQQQSEMFLRMQQLQDELRSIRGDLELHGHTLKIIQRRQQEIYRDLDERIGKLESAASSASQGETPAGGGEGVSAQPEVAVGADEQQAYQQAFAHLRKLEYPQAVSGFAGYLKAYPEGRYAPNAQYWLGEIRYVRGAYKRAIAEYRKFVEGYPDSARVPEALLKMGLSYRELGSAGAARKQFESLLKRFPDSAEAEQARQYLK